MIKVLEKRPGSAAYFSRVPEGYDGYKEIENRVGEGTPCTCLNYMSVAEYEFVIFYNMKKGTPLNNTGVVIIAEENDNHIGSISRTLEEMRKLFPQLFKE